MKKNPWKGYPNKGLKEPVREFDAYPSVFDILKKHFKIKDKE